MESEINIWRSYREEELLRKAERHLDIKRQIRNETVCKVRTALKKLSPTEHDVMTMRFIGIDHDGSGELKTMTLQEIADHYDKEYTWVTTTQGRALKKLQQMIDRGELHE